MAKYSSKLDLFDVRSNKPALNDINDDESVVEDGNNNGEDMNILCLLYKNGKLGATYYNIRDKIIYLYEETADNPPQFLVTATLLRKVDPKFIISFGSITEQFNQVIIEHSSPENNRDSTTSTVRSLPQNICLLRLTDYGYDLCRTIISNIDISWRKHERDRNPETIRNLYLNSLVNFDHRFSVQALGALYKYLEQNWTYFGLENGNLQVMDINKATMKNHLLIDNFSFKALQIFSQRSHEALFKRGSQSSGREGLSLYKLFLGECKSKIGHTRLRHLLLNPINDIGELNKRLDFISFVLNPHNKDFIEALQENVKHLGDVCYISGVLVKIENGKASNRDWQILYKTIYHTIFISEICGPHKEKAQIFQELQDSVTTDLMSLEGSINNALDFEAGRKRRRPAIKFGLDESLDAKLLMQQDIVKHVTAAARFAVEDLPDYINECKVAYLPEMGHLVVVREWEPDCDPDELLYLGFRFMFKLKSMIHYKSPLCVELDSRLGDINADIVDHENRILRRLSSFTVNYNKDIREPLRIIALIDSLISMAQVANRCNFVRPSLNTASVHEIKECRHPLMEQSLTSFETNDFYSGGPHPKMKIITGPNGSGKSVFLKQMGLVLYMAHIGSFLPAKNANIGMLHSIHSRLHATEAISVKLSGFMIDITQSSQAITNALGNSLVILDEFGKGTSDDNGLAILAGVLKMFLSNPETCPHVLVATHQHKVLDYVPESNLVEYLQMSHSDEDGSLCFLFKLTTGVSDSYAINIAADFLDSDLMSRIKYLHECFKNNTPIRAATKTPKRVTQVPTNVDCPQPDEESLSDDDDVDEDS